MTPRKRKYESDAERQKAYRERKKKRNLKDRLKQLFNGEVHTQDTLPSTDISQQSKTKPNGTVLIYDKFTGKRVDNLETKPKENSTEEALNSENSEPKIIRSACLYCNAQMGYSEAKEDERCRFCRQWKSKEESEFARKMLRRLSLLVNWTKSEKQKMFEEAMVKWRKGEMPND